MAATDDALTATLAAATDAFAAWGRDADDVRLVSHSENIVCAVRCTDGERFALRLHRPGYNSLDEMRSEVAWVESLDAAGLDVARPVATPAGEYYVEASDGRRPCYAGLVQWVAGTPIAAEIASGTVDIRRRYHQLGAIAAAIRVQSVSWTPPHGFVRRRWDTEGLLGERALWGRFWESPVLTNAQRALFVRARDRLAHVLDAAGEARDRFGLIHADLHTENVMALGDRLTVIDFDDAGYGLYAYELAVALHHLIESADFDGARDALFEGYGSIHPLDDIDIELVDALLVVRCLVMVAWLDARPTAGGYSRRAEYVAETERAIIRTMPDLA